MLKVYLAVLLASGPKANPDVEASEPNKKGDGEKDKRSFV
jgi:hypothetical protein